MHELYELKNKLIKELAAYGSKDMSAGTLDVVDKLAHAIKNICKIIDDTEYSETGRDYSRDGYRHMVGGSYARGRTARRDTMGRYSSDGSFVDELRDLMNEAPDEHTRMELGKLVTKMERM